MTDDTPDDEMGINRRTVLKSAAVASGVGFVGLPAFSGHVAASSHTETLTLVSDTSTKVVGRRAGTGENESDCTFVDLDTNAVPSWEHPAWEDTTECFDSTADWIWYSTEDKKISGSDEYYVLNNEKGDVVEFERTFQLDGEPVDGEIMIAVDNGFEVYVNDNLVASRAVNDGDDIDWECSDLKLPYVGTDGWRTGGDCANITYDIPTGYLTEGENTLTVLGVNAHNRQGKTELDDGENPGGLIYEMDVDYEACATCDTGDELLVKYEWDDEAGEFVVEGDADENVELTSVSLDGDGEPTEACFDVDYCEVDIVVKAGLEYETTEDASGEVCVSGIETENGGGYEVTHAISNVRFYCEAPEDLSVGDGEGSDDGEAEGQGQDQDGEDDDRGHGNDDGDDPDNPGNEDSDDDDGNSGHGDDSDGGSSGDGGGGGNGRGR